MLCTVREVPSSELRFCFELISPNRRAYTLQAEAEREMLEWIQVFQNCTEHMLSQQVAHAVPSASAAHRRTTTFQRHIEDVAALLQELRLLNPTCVDCGVRGACHLLLLSWPRLIYRVSPSFHFA